MIKAHSFRRLLYRILFFWLFVALLAYGVLCAYLYSAQRDLLYVTNKSTYRAPDRAILPHIQEVTLYTPDGFELMAWYQPPKDGYKTILYLHGNATSISHLQSSFAHIVGGDYGLLAFSYRGYGASNGKPSEAGLFLDAETAVEFLHQHGIEPANIIVMGRSLGTGVAVHLATLHPFHQTILISPYTSITHVAQLRYPYVPISWLLKDHFDSLTRAPHIISPVCIFHGKKDTIIPEEQSARLMDAILAPKERIVYPDADHIHLDMPSILLALRTQCPQR